MVLVAVFPVQLVIIGKILCNGGILDILKDEILPDLKAQVFADLHHFGEILPAAGRCERDAVRRGFDAVEISLPQLQIRQDGAVDRLVPSVLLPDGKVRFHVDPSHAVQRHDVEFARGAVVFRRVSGRDDDPSFRHLLVAERLPLQKLKHGGGQRLGDAIDLVDKEDSLPEARLLHPVVDGGDDLAHGVFRHGMFPARIGLFQNERQADGALPRVVRDGVGHQRHPAFPRGLFDHLRFADAGRAHQQQRPLPHRRDAVVPVFIPPEVCADGVFNLFFCLFNIHNGANPPSLRFDLPRPARAALSGRPAPGSASSPTAARPRR